MRTRRHTFAGIAVLGLAAVPALAALSGRDGYTSSLLFTPDDVPGAVTYPSGFSGVRWSDLNDFELWAPIGQGQRDGISADRDGSLYVLVRGRDSNMGNDPEYTGLVHHDGSAFRHLTQARMDSGFYATRLGTELRAVTVSPSGVGALTTGDPVVVRHEIEEVSGVRVFHAHVLVIDTTTGAETLVHRFNEEANQARVAIDGSGTSSDGTIYVGPMSDGRIAVLTYSAGTYAKSYVPGSFRAGAGLLAGPGGTLFTFAASETWSGATKDVKDIYEVDPGDGSASVYASVAGWTFPFDWEWSSDDRLWIALRSSGGKTRRYVTEVQPGKTTGGKQRVSESDDDPWSIAAGASGALYVLEDPFSVDGEVWELLPGSGGGGGGGGGGGNGKGKNK